MKNRCRTGMMVFLIVFICATAIAGPIHDAAGTGKIEQVRQLLLEGVDVNTISDDGNTPLHAAAIWGHKDVAEVLLSRGADVHAKESNGMTPLHFAATGDHTDLAVLLIVRTSMRRPATDGRPCTLRLFGVTKAQPKCLLPAVRMSGQRLPLSWHHYIVRQ
jgi:ankyrin repeat protein